MNTPLRFFRSPRLGATLLEVVFVLMITVSAITGALAFYSDYLGGQARLSAAQQMRDISYVAHEYVQERYSRLVAELQPAGVREITGDLRFLGLPLSQYKNNYQQEYRVFVRATSTPADGMELLVVTDNGETIAAKDATQIVRMLGAVGGYTGDSGEVVSPSAGIDVDLASTYGLARTEGRLVAKIPLSHAKGNDADMLFRNAITGRDNLNRMHTDFDMGGHRLTDIDEYQSETLSASDALHVPPYNAGSEPVFNSAGTRIRSDIDEINTQNANIHHLRTGPNSSPADLVQGALTASGDGRIDGNTHTRTIYTYGSDVDLRQINGRSGGSVTTRDLEGSGILMVEPYDPVVSGEPNGRLVQPEVAEYAICPKEGLLGRTSVPPTVFMLCKANPSGVLRWQSVLKGEGVAIVGFNTDITTGQADTNPSSDFLVIHRAFHSMAQRRIRKTIPGHWGACFLSSARTTKEGTAWGLDGVPTSSWAPWVPLPSPGGGKDKFYYEGYANYVHPHHPYKQRRYQRPYQGAMQGYIAESSSHCIVSRDTNADDAWYVEARVPMNNYTEHWCHAACLR